jgi:hypothetical protein
MTSGLRKAHTYIWLLLIIIVPLVMFFSMKDLAIFSLENNKMSQFESSKKEHLKTFENDIVKITVFDSQVEIILKTTLKNAASIVYEMDEKGNKSNLIGQVTTAGIYTFNTNKLLKGIIIYDDIKQVEITKFSL